MPNHILFYAHLGTTFYAKVSGLYPGNIFSSPAGTLRYIYVVFMLQGYVKIMLGFMLECLVFLT